MASEKEKETIQEIIKRQYEQVQTIRQRADEIEHTRKTLEGEFGSLQKALEKITSIKSNDPTAIALQKIRNQTESFQRVMEKHKYDLATIVPLNPGVFGSGTARRKQKYKFPAITNQVVQSVKPKQRPTKEEAVKQLIKTLKSPDKNAKKKTITLADGRKKNIIYYGYGKDDGSGGNVMDWMWDNDIHDYFGIVKHYKKSKTRYIPKNWDDLTQILRSLNFRPEEVLEYSLQKIQTKERYLEHRLYRNIEARNASGLEDFIEIYKKHLATKKPFKTFFYSKALASWCASEDIFFKSEENCRINKDLMVKAWNKKYPAEKINDKKKK